MRTLADVVGELRNIHELEAELKGKIRPSKIPVLLDEILEISKANESVKGDLISKSALVLHLNDYALKESPSPNESTEERRISEMVYRVIQNCIEAVEEQPTACNDGWISVKDRLPEEGMTVLTQDFEDYYEVCNVETKNGVIGFSNGDWWASANNYLAWHSLPQPYKENENETT